MKSNVLLLDTSQKGRALLAVCSQTTCVAKSVVRSKFHVTDTLVKRIDALLARTRTPLQHIGGIIVVLGPGPFSALRGSVTIANALAFALRIPAVGLKQDEFKTPRELLLKGRVRLAHAPHILFPYYGAPPAIGKLRPF